MGGKEKQSPPAEDEGEARSLRHIIAIASSTGGPKALNVILPELPEDFESPVVIAQHIAEGFVHGMVGWLDQISKVKVKIAEAGELLKPGTVYVSPPDRHTVINYGDRISFIDRKSSDIYHPSCDVLLMSVASVYGAKAIGVILTGMGSDGVKGIQKIKEARGITLAQDEETSIVFGMPRLAIESGYIDTVLPQDKIGGELVRRVKA
jgi:two-component system chemotaxis response regulator CheB